MLLTSRQLRLTLKVSGLLRVEETVWTVLEVGRDGELQAGPGMKSCKDALNPVRRIFFPNVIPSQRCAFAPC
jgi:hypothetical protein